MPEKLEYYQDIAKEDISSDKDRNEMFEGIDSMYENDWELPDELKDIEWLRTFKTTAPHDAIVASTRVFATQFPSIAVQPLAPNQSEMDETERIESLLDWHLFQTLRRGIQNPLWEIMSCAVKYSMVSFQTEFMPWKYMNSTDPLSMSRRNHGDFALVLHNPKNVHPRYSSYGLDSVTLAYQTTALDVYNTYGKDNPGVADMVSRLETSEALKAVLAKQKLTFYDYTDYVDRVQWVSLGEQFDDTGGSNPIEIRREAHGLPFINWVIRKDNHPLLKPVYDAKLWENANILESLRYCLVLATVAQARTWSRTTSREGVEIDHTEPGSQVRMGPGEEFGILPPSQLDQNMNVLIEGVRGDIRQATVAQALTTLENLPQGTPYATINAILQAAISSLAPIRNIGEEALADTLYQFLMWSKFSGIPLLGVVRKAKSTTDETRMMGAQIMLNPDEFDPYNMYITVSLDAESPTDRQARLNMAILEAQQLPVSPRKAMEDQGMEYTDADLEEYSNWKYFDAEMQADIKRIMSKPDIEAQQQLMSQQQEQQPSPENQVRANNSMGATEGFNPAMGAPSPYEGQPGMTRESVTGQSVSGEEV